MGRHKAVVGDRTFWFGWDNPTQSFFFDEENDQPDPCENCDRDFNAVCPDLCPGHGYEELICHFGPMVGKMVRTLDGFKLAVQDILPHHAVSEYYEIYTVAMADYGTRTPPTALQRAVNQMFANLTEEV